MAAVVREVSQKIVLRVLVIQERVAKQLWGLSSLANVRQVRAPLLLLVHRSHSLRAHRCLVLEHGRVVSALLMSCHLELGLLLLHHGLSDLLVVSILEQLILWPEVIVILEHILPH